MSYSRHTQKENENKSWLSTLGWCGYPVNLTLEYDVPVSWSLIPPLKSPENSYIEINLTRTYARKGFHWNILLPWLDIFLQKMSQRSSLAFPLYFLNVWTQILPKLPICPCSLSLPSKTFAKHFAKPEFLTNFSSLWNETTIPHPSKHPFGNFHFYL